MAVKKGAYSLEEKREAVAYFNKNEVPKQIEELLNKMFKEKPIDVFGYMGEYFGRRSHAPTISKVSAAEILGSRGFPTFEVRFDCTINGLSKVHGKWFNLMITSQTCTCLAFNFILF